MDERLKPSEKVKILTKELNQGNRAYKRVMTNINKNCKVLKKKISKTEKFIGTQQKGRMYGYREGLQYALDLFHSLYKISELTPNDNEEE